MSFVAGAIRWDGEQAVFLWSQVSSTVQPLILEMVTSQIMLQALLNTAVSEKGALLHRKGLEVKKSSQLQEGHYLLIC